MLTPTLKGSIFERREDWSILSRIPICKQNTIHIRLEDEGPYGNDETRCFVLSHLSALGVKQLTCVSCDCQLVVYDRFPLVDGTLFLSPDAYATEKSIVISNANGSKGPSSSASPYSLLQQYMHAICLSCVLGKRGHELECRHCHKDCRQGYALVAERNVSSARYSLQVRLVRR